MYYTSVFLQSTNSILEECRKNLSLSKRTIRISDVRNEIGWKRRRRRKNVVVTREIILFGQELFQSFVVDRREVL